MDTKYNKKNNEKGTGKAKKVSSVGSLLGPHLLYTPIFKISIIFIFYKKI